jgi:hypothetical protein
VDGVELLCAIRVGVNDAQVVHEELGVVVDVVVHHDPHRLLQCVLAHLPHGELLPILVFMKGVDVLRTSAKMQLMFHISIVGKYCTK